MIENNILGIILAGGKSSRFGEDKSIAKLGDKTLLDHTINKIEKEFTEILVISNNKEFNFKITSTHNTFIYLINGEIEIGKNKHDQVKDSTLILLTKGEDLSVRAKSNSKFLAISGKPINEEIARGGPFVMNTKSEILQAVQDYHNGTFVKK